MSHLVSLPTDRGGISVSYASPVTFALVDADATSYYEANVMVHRVDFTLLNPSAVLEVQFGRITPTDNSSSLTARRFAGNSASVEHLPAWGSTSTSTFSAVLGSYFITGPGIHEVHFTDECLEALNKNDGGDAFGVYAQRVDVDLSDDASTQFHMNVWYEHYR